MTTSDTGPDTRLAALLLTNQLTRVDAAPLKASEFWTVVARADAIDIELGALLGADESALRAVADTEVTEAGAGADAEATETGAGAAPRRARIEVQRLQRLLSATRALAFEIERLDEGGIKLITALSAEFPGLVRDRLQHRCPPILFVAGPTGWLQDYALAIVGADDANAGAMRIARSAAAAAVVAEWAVVADHSQVGTAQLGNTQIGDAVVAEALACGGHVVTVASVGINRAARVPAVRKLVQAGELCLASPYAPDAPSTPAASRARDTIVHALGHTAFVAAAHDGMGPTWAAALDATQREPASVATWLGSGSEPGNQALAGLGARPIGTITDLHDLLGIS